MRKLAMKSAKSIVVIAMLFVAVGLAIASQKPQLVNAKLVEQATSGDLAKDVAAIAGPAWVGYSAPVIPGEHHMCCWNSVDQFRANQNCCGGCSLEKRDGGSFIGDKMNDCRLEPSTEFFVLLRVQGGKV